MTVPACPGCRKLLKTSNPAQAYGLSFCNQLCIVAYELEQEKDHAPADNPSAHPSGSYHVPAKRVEDIT